MPPDRSPGLPGRATGAFRPVNPLAIAFAQSLLLDRPLVTTAFALPVATAARRWGGVPRLINVTTGHSISPIEELQPAPARPANARRPVGHHGERTIAAL